jgi:hypothetical protein
LLGIFVTVGFIVARSIKSKSDLGENFVHYFQHQELFWLAVVVFILMIGEAGFVATFHPQDKIDYIPFGPRFIGHLGINLAGYIATINAPKKWYELFAILPPIGSKDRAKHLQKMKDANITVTKIVMLLIYAVFSTAISISLPAINVVILANGLEQMTQVTLFVQDWFQPMEDYYAALPREYLGINSKLPEGIEYAGANYSPFQDMRYALQIVIAMVGVHYPLAFMKGMAGMMNTGSHTVIFRPQPKEEKKEEKKDKDQESEDVTTLLKGARTLLKFFGYSGTALQSKIDEVNSKLKSMNPTIQATLSSNLAQMTRKLKKHQEENFANQSQKQVKIDIKAFFSRPTKQGTGLGITLSQAMIDGSEDEDEDDEV